MRMPVSKKLLTSGPNQYSIIIGNMKGDNMLNIQDWIEHLIEETDLCSQLKITATPKGWSAKLIDEDNYILLDSQGDIFMIAECGSIEGALTKLDKMCANDLKKIVAAVC
jgi:hypothetical protein